MATGDISRNAFDPKKHYSGVRMQQGRVITDDDWNDNERIEDEDRRRARIDIIGPAGSPDDGFKIKNPTMNNGKIDFNILPGSFYLGGLRLEMGEMETFLTQKDWLKPDNPLTKPDDRFDLVYLEAWQQPVSAVEDSELFEVALGGPDTSTRMRNMRRVKVARHIKYKECQKDWETLQTRWKDQKLGTLNPENQRVPDVTLTVGFNPDEESLDHCKPKVTAGYLGAENQAVRVQLTGPNRLLYLKDSNCFTWGFDNASPLYRVKVEETGSEVTMLTEPKDQSHWPLAGQVIEILPRSAVLPNGQKIAEIQGEFFKAQTSYNPDDGTFTINGTLSAGFGIEWYIASDEETFFYMRVWNRGSDLTSAAEIPFVVDGPAVDLGHTGLTVSFSGEDHVAGDYWIIAARPETPDKVVPWKLKGGLVAPQGIHRYYAPLAVIEWKSGVGSVISDCRETFKPLTELEAGTGCCVTVGDGITSFGEFSSITNALSSPKLVNGGKICLLSGVHSENVILSQRDNIQITGCGLNTIVHPKPGYELEPVFIIHNCRNIRLDNMTLVNATGTAIQVRDAASRNDSRGISIRDNRIIAWKHAVEIWVFNKKAGGNSIHILHNQIGMINKAGGKTAVFCSADDVLIRDNRIVTLPEPAEKDETDPRKSKDESVAAYEKDTEAKVIYVRSFILSLVEQTLLYVSSAGDFKPRVSQTLGGIQINGCSDQVRIVDNIIIGGAGNGIALGSDIENEKFNIIYEIYIERNTIRSMRLSGIGPFKQDFGSHYPLVENLTIEGNLIESCAWLDDQNLSITAVGGVVLAAAENTAIHHNRIQNNGLTYKDPICGVYIKYGENIDISHNRIVNNGPIEFLIDADIRTGKRGGIVIDTCVSFEYTDIRDAADDQVYTRQTLSLTEVAGEFGLHAFKAHDNVVMQPLGRALSLNVRGPVSILNNRFTTLDIDFRNSPETVWAGCVYIFNFGLSQNLVGLMISIFDLFNIEITDNFNWQSILIPLINTVMGNYFPGGNVNFCNNQVTLELRGKEFAGRGSRPDIDLDFALSSILIFSLDDVGFMGNQTDCNFFIDALFTNTAIFAVSGRSCNNRFKEGLLLAFYSLFSLGLINTATNNQATHCLYARGKWEPNEGNGNIKIFPSQFCKPFESFFNKLFDKDET
jgi:hypothetical protein